MDFESIEKLNNEAIIQLYEDIVLQNSDYSAQYLQGYGRCDNGKSGSRAVSGAAPTRCNTYQWYSVGTTWFRSNDGSYYFTDRALVGDICGNNVYGHVYITGCRD